MRLTPVSCCGIREIAELSYHKNGKDAIEAFYALTSKPVPGTDPMYNPGRPHGWDSRFRYAVFSQAYKHSTYGVRFAEYIKEHGLGTLVETDFNENPNSGNQLKAWIWTVDHAAVKAHCEGKKSTTSSASKILRDAQGRFTSSTPSSTISLQQEINHG